MIKQGFSGLWENELFLILQCHEKGHSTCSEKQMLHFATGITPTHQHSPDIRSNLAHIHHTAVPHS